MTPPHKLSTSRTDAPIVSVRLAKPFARALAVVATELKKVNKGPASACVTIKTGAKLLLVVKPTRTQRKAMGDDAKALADRLARLTRPRRRGRPAKDKGAD